MKKTANIFVLALLATTVAATAQTPAPETEGAGTPSPKLVGPTAGTPSVDITAEGPNGQKAGSVDVTKNGVDFQVDGPSGDLSVDVTKGKNGSYDIKTIDNGKQVGNVDLPGLSGMKSAMIDITVASGTAGSHGGPRGEATLFAPSAMIIGAPGSHGDFGGNALAFAPTHGVGGGSGTSLKLGSSTPNKLGK